MKKLEKWIYLILVSCLSFAVYWVWQKENYYNSIFSQSQNEYAELYETDSPGTIYTYVGAKWWSIQTWNGSNNKPTTWTESDEPIGR